MPYNCCGLFDESEFPCTRGVVVGRATAFGDFGATAELLGGVTAALGAGAIGLGAMIGVGGFGIGAVGRTAGGRTALRYWALAIGVMNSDTPMATERDRTFFISKILATS